jgi:uncharacterized membrane protein (DUF4010 family)
MEFGATLARLALAAGLGLLVGLQRERASRLAGLRTFSLITLFGFLSGMLSSPLGGWPVAAGAVALAVILVGGSFLDKQAARADPGVTTEVAAVLMYGVGAYLAVGDTRVAVALGAGIAGLLAFKVELHHIAQQLSESDVKAIVQFALLSLVILPALPDRTFGPYNVLNPRQIWWMVVLIVGLGLTGYIVHRFVPQHTSLALSGVLGGTVSSTATTASYARIVKQGGFAAAPAAAVVLIASSVAFVRLVIEIASTAPALLRSAAVPLISMALPLAVASFFMIRNAKESALERDLGNPSRLPGALVFAALYAAVLFGTAAARERLGGGALYSVAALSGLVDLDAITLSTSRLVATSMLEPAEGSRMVVMAAVANLVSKAIIAGLLGTRAVMLRIAGPYSVSVLAAAAAALILWF